MQNLKKILVKGILGASLIFCSIGKFGCATQKEIKEKETTVINKKIEKPVITSLSEAGINSLIDSELLSKEERISVNQQYCRLIQFTNKELVKAEINRFADYRFGNKDGKPSLYERNRAYEALFSVLKTVADVNENYNGKAESWEIRKYYEKFGNKPLVEVIRGHSALNIE